MNDSTTGRLKKNRATSDSAASDPGYLNMQKRPINATIYSAKETYNFREPTDCSHPIDSMGRVSHVNFANMFFACICMFCKKYMRNSAN